jgi:hypothetical protein
MRSRMTLETGTKQGYAMHGQDRKRVAEVLADGGLANYPRRVEMLWLSGLREGSG